jgi:outer membrane receptor protein involved in Fe transport
MSLAALLCLLSHPLGSSAVAEPAAASPVDFDIPAQPISSALRAYARQANLQLLVLTDGLEAVQSNAVVGKYEARNALRTLLAGTGLQAEHRPDATVAIRRLTESTRRLDDSGASDKLLLASRAENKNAPQTREENPPEQSRRDLDESGDLPRTLEEIVVTGSRIRGAQNASPVITITRQEIEHSGYATVEDLVEKLPQNFGAGAGQDTRTNPLSSETGVVGGNVEALSTGTSVNLRGLGASSTLILVNGRRMSPSGRSARYTDISGIPVAAIEQVEVLTDGASAIYGSDAIAGVINFVLRHDYEGAETRIRYGTDDSRNTSEMLAAQALGASWDTGNALLAYEYYKHDNLANTDRAFAATADLRSFGGDDRRTPGGNPANVRAGGQTFAIPRDQDGTNLSPADFDSTAPLNLYNSRANGDLLPRQERHSAFLRLVQNIGRIEAFADIRYSRHSDEFHRDFGTLNIAVPNSNPFFVDPAGTGLSTVTVLGYSFSEDLGPSLVRSETKSSDVALGANVGISENWNGELVAHWSKETTKKRRDNIVDRSRLAEAVSPSDPDLAFNPFADGSNTNPSVLNSLRTGIEDNFVQNELSAVSINVDGSAFRMGGGSVKIASGIEVRRDSLASLVDENGVATRPELDTSRDISAVYAEIFFPLISEINGRRGAERLELSLAGRHENYSDFGSGTSPKLGTVWSPTEWLSLRATYGESYRAPALFDLDVDHNANTFVYLPQFFVDEGLIPFPTLVLQGANENLKPEKAATWTAGFRLHPGHIKGWSLDGTYFSIDFDDRVDTPFSNILDGFSDPRFHTLLNTSPSQAQIEDVINDPRYTESAFGFSTAATDILSGAAPVGGILDRRKTNLSKAVVTGLELQLAYGIKTAFGSWNLGLNGNYLLDFKRRFIDGDPLVDEVDTFGRPVDFRARANATFSRNSWLASAFVNYVDGYTDNVSEPERRVHSWTTLDFTLSYDTGTHTGDRSLSDFRLTFVAENVFNRDPPFVNTLDGLAYDTSNANSLGRVLSLQVTKEW